MSFCFLCIRYGCSKAAHESADENSKEIDLANKLEEKIKHKKFKDAESNKFTSIVYASLRYIKS